MIARALLCALALAACASPAADEDDEPFVDFIAIEEHRLSEEPEITVDWAHDAPSLVRQAYPSGWGVDGELDASGVVTDARLRWGPSERSEDALAAARALRFQPFTRRGEPVPVEFTINIRARRQDYVGPADRAFPDDVDPSDIVIRLQRTECYGRCPAYELEIRGDGEVVYRGGAFSLIEGEHSWRIAPSAVGELIALFRRADYFNLAGYYELQASDLPTYITGLSIGDQHKFVVDYGFSGMAEAVASASLGPGRGPPMPPIVNEIENTIDRLAGAVSWVRGDARTIEVLRAAGWDFRSAASGRAMAFAASDCRLDVARGLLAEGAPADGGYPTWGDRPVPAVALASYCGDPDFVRLLTASGAARDPETARVFLVAAVRSGYPDVLAEALRYDRSVNTPDEGMTLIQAADDAYNRFQYEDTLPPARFDRAANVALLLQAGADPNQRDREGLTALDTTDDAAVAALLIEAGATLPDNARDMRALLDRANEEWSEIPPVLLERARRLGVEP